MPASGEVFKDSWAPSVDTNPIVKVAAPKAPDPTQPNPKMINSPGSGESDDAPTKLPKTNESMGLIGAGAPFKSVYHQ